MLNGKKLEEGVVAFVVMVAVPSHLVNVPLLKPPEVNVIEPTEAVLTPNTKVPPFKLTSPFVKVTVPETVPVLFTGDTLHKRLFALLKVTPDVLALLKVKAAKFAVDPASVVAFLNLPVPEID